MRTPIVEIEQGGADARGHDWYWRLLAVNGRIVAVGAEAFATHANALRSVRRVAHLFGANRVRVYRWNPKAEMWDHDGNAVTR